jgi:hypothetical protein
MLAFDREKPEALLGQQVETARPVSGRVPHDRAVRDLPPKAAKAESDAASGPPRCIAEERTVRERAAVVLLTEHSPARQGLVPQESAVAEVIQGLVSRGKRRPHDSRCCPSKTHVSTTMTSDS